MGGRPAAWCKAGCRHLPQGPWAEDSVALRETAKVNKSVYPVSTAMMVPCNKQAGGTQQEASMASACWVAGWVALLALAGLPPGCRESKVASAACLCFPCLLSLRGPAWWCRGVNVHIQLGTYPLPV